MRVCLAGIRCEATTKAPAVATGADFRDTMLHKKMFKDEAALVTPERRAAVATIGPLVREGRLADHFVVRPQVGQATRARRLPPDSALPAVR
jgi:hypothetical protein